MGLEPLANITLTDAVTSIGVLLTGIGLIYTGVQLKLSRRIARNDFLLQLYRMMDQHNELHARLTGTGWPDRRSGPESTAEWLEVGRALGLFEYIGVLVQDRLLAIELVDRLFAYRLYHLSVHPAIKQQFLSEGRGWDAVVDLIRKLENCHTFQMLEAQRKTSICAVSQESRTTPS